MRTLSVIQHYFKDSPARISALISVCLVVIILVTSAFSKDSTTEPEDVTYLSDLIPDGHMLIPVQVVNGEALSQMMDLSAYVDLYSIDLVQQKKQLLFKRVKIIKNPSESTSFSVLLSEDKSHQLNFIENPVFAVLKSKRTKSRPVKKTTKSRFQVMGEEI